MIFWSSGETPADYGRDARSPTRKNLIDLYAVLVARTHRAYAEPEPAMSSDLELTPRRGGRASR